MQTRQTFVTLVAIGVALTTIADEAAARGNRVAVAPFAGPGEVARSAHEAVVDIARRHYDVVPSIEILEASAEAGADARSPRAAMRVARITGADVVVIGRVAPSGDGYKLTLSVRQAASGRSVGAVLIPMFTESVGQEAYGQIKPLLLHLLRSVKLVETRRSNAREAVTVVTTRPEADSADEDEDEDDDELEPIDLPFTIVAAAGLSATARRLSFAQEAGLALSGVSGNPTPGLRIEGEARTKGEDNLGVAFRVDRSVGGKVAVQSGAAEIPLTQTQWGIDLRGRVKVRRFEAIALLGYSELSYQLTLPPEGLMLPSASYAFLNGGGGIGTRIAGGALNIQLTARYLQVLSSSGITDQGAFGRASSRGFDTELGVEIRASDSIFVRFGASHLRLVHQFDGSGALTTNLDDDPELDVAGAVDAFTGGYAQLAFVL